MWRLTSLNKHEHCMFQNQNAAWVIYMNVSLKGTDCLQNSFDGIFILSDKLRSWAELLRLQPLPGKQLVLPLRGLHGGPETRGPDPGPVRVRVYILNGQPGPGRVPIYYFGSRVCLTLCVIPESIGEHRTHQRSASVSMCVCNLQFVKLRWEKCEREIGWKKKNSQYLSRQKGRS